MWNVLPVILKIIAFYAGSMDLYSKAFKIIGSRISLYPVYSLTLLPDSLMSLEKYLSLFYFYLLHLYLFEGRSVFKLPYGTHVEGRTQPQGAWSLLPPYIDKNSSKS